MSSLLNISLNKSTDEFEGISYNSDLVDLLASTILHTRFTELTSLDLDTNSNLWRPDESLDTSITSQLSIYELPSSNESSIQVNESYDSLFSEHIFDDSLNSFDSINFDDFPSELNQAPSPPPSLVQPLTSSPNNQSNTSNPITFEPNLDISLEHNFEIKLPALYDSLDSSSNSVDVTNTSNNDNVLHNSPIDDNSNEDHIDYNVLDSWLDKFCGQTEAKPSPPIKCPATSVKPITIIPQVTTPVMIINNNSTNTFIDNDYIAPSPAPSMVSTISSISYHSSIDGGDSINSARPPVSYLQMIAEAILDNPSGRALLTDIYSYVIRTYPYFESQKPAWRNSIRHNLSVNGCFTKNGKAPTGRGFYWSVSDEHIVNFRNGNFDRKNRYQMQHKRRINTYIQNQHPQQVLLPQVHISPSNQCFAPNFISKFVPNAPTFTLFQ